MCREAKETAVHAAFQDPSLNFRVVTEQQFVVDVRVILLELFDDVRQLVSCNTGKGSDADESSFQPGQFVHLYLKFLIFFADAFWMRQKFESFGGKPHSRTASFKEGQLSFGFKVMDHSADS